MSIFEFFSSSDPDVMNDPLHFGIPLHVHRPQSCGHDLLHLLAEEKL